MDGIEMGVLENGMPYLTQSGLARMAGVSRRNISDISKEWERSFNDPAIPPRTRIGFIKRRLFDQGYDHPKLYLEVPRDNSLHYAYPDEVCTAIIEYFAFEARETNGTAIKNFRNFATYGLQNFIYKVLDYAPDNAWRYFNDRVSLLKDKSPTGYFILFQEVTGLIVDLINAGLPVNYKTIPDVSVGSHWGRYWNDNNLHEDFGERVEWEHRYPPYYPQAASNPQPAWAYPDKALPAFRRWFRSTYLPSKFPPYILRKAGVLKGGKQEAERIAGMYALPAPEPDDE